MFFGFFAGCVRDFQVEAQKATFVVIFVAVEKHMFGVFCIFASVGAKLENFCVPSSLARVFLGFFWLAICIEGNILL